MMYTISVITPTFNQAEFIERTISSVISQKGNFQIEYIIIDGQSTDDTITILKTYEKRLKQSDYEHVKFVWLSEKDNGQADAINKGLKIATGDILTYINSDDTYNEGALSVITNAFSGGNHDRCYGKCRIINRNDEEIRFRITYYKNLRLPGRTYGKLLTENFISQMTVFRTRKAFNEIGFFDPEQHLCLDYEYWLRLGKRYRPLYIDKYLANFRFYETSKSGVQYRKQFTTQLALAKKHANGSYKIPIFIHSLFFRRTIWIYGFLAYIKK